MGMFNNNNRDMSETIHDRIKEIVDRLAGGKNTVFANTLGVSEANIRGYIKNITPKYDFLRAVVTSYGVSAHWLLTGEGDMLRGEGDSSSGEKRLCIDVPLSNVGKESSSAEVIAYLVGVIQRQAEEIGCLKNMLNK